MKLEGACLCGSVTFRFDAECDGVTACNCTACRRYGTLWAYDYEGEGIHVSGETTAYLRPEGKSLSFNFCPRCGCVAFWRSRAPDPQGRRRMAVNVRLEIPKPSRICPSTTSTASILSMTSGAMGAA